MTFRTTLVISGVALAALAAACSGKPKGDDRFEGTRRMAERLAGIVRDWESHPLDNPFMNKEKVPLLREELKNAIHPRDYLQQQGTVAIELLNAGMTDEALQELGKLSQFFAQPGVEAGPQARRFVDRHLAIAHLRLGEQQNCQLNHTVDSCLMPIRDQGVHRLEQGSRSAVAVLGPYLERHPDDLEGRWLLNLAYMTLGEWPAKVPARQVVPPKAFESEWPAKRFKDIAGDLGLDVDDLAGGASADDFDNDGDYDIFASSQGFWSQLRYFVNNGDGTFTERTKEAGLTGLTGGLNINQTDYDNDGFIDLFVMRGGWMRKAGHYPKSLLRNNGDGTFSDVTEEAGLFSLHPTQTSTWLDYDGDGHLDLFVGHESVEDDPHASELYHNDGDGTFTNCTLETGLAIFRYVKGVASGDINNDGRPDLYVSARGQPNVLFRNDGPKPGAKGACGWRFTDISEQAGVTEPIDSFPTWMFDYDNDGWVDIFVSGYRFNGAGDILADLLGLPYDAERPRLYRNNRDGTFADASREARVFRVTHAMGCNYGDIDNDGWLDYYAGTGDPNLGSLIPNRMFRNAEGKFFQDVTTAAGVGHLQKGHGVAFADFDHDGDQDIYQVMGGAYQGDNYRNTLYENPGYDNHWIKLKLEGTSSNRAAIGARIKVVAGTPTGERAIYKTVSSGASFGASPLVQEIGLGRATEIKGVEIFWPKTGRTQTLRGLAIDTAYRVREDAGAAEVVALKPFRFKTGGGAHAHH